MNGAPGLVLYGGLARLYDPTPDPSFKGKDNQFGLKQTTLRCSQNIHVEVSRSHCWRCTFENQQHRGLITYLLLFYLQEAYILLGTRHAKMNKTPSTEVFSRITKLDEEWGNSQKCSETSFGEDEKEPTFGHVELGIPGGRWKCVNLRISL